MDRENFGKNPITDQQIEDLKEVRAKRNENSKHEIKSVDDKKSIAEWNDSISLMLEKDGNEPEKWASNLLKAADLILAAASSYDRGGECSKE